MINLEKLTKDLSIENIDEVIGGGRGKGGRKHGGRKHGGRSGGNSCGGSSSSSSSSSSCGDGGVDVVVDPGDVIVML